MALLLIIGFAAIIASILWYKHAPSDPWRLSVLCYLYWGAFLMWLVDAAYEYAKLREGYFSQSISQVIDDSLLGFSAALLGLFIWFITLLIKDPKGIFQKNQIQKL